MNTKTIYKKMARGLLWILGCAPASGRAQTFQEWFSQKKTELRYYIQQLAALNAYDQDLRAGMSLNQEWLSGIDATTEEEFLAHKDHIGSLTRINPSMLADGSISITAGRFREISSLLSKTLMTAHIPGAFIPDEISYIGQVCLNTSNEQSRSLDRFSNLTLENWFRMNDGERKQELDRVYEDVEIIWAFTRFFNNLVLSMAAERAIGN